MVNVLGGPAGGAMPDRYPAALADQPEVKFHSYGKESATRAARSGTSPAIGDELDDVVAGRVPRRRSSRAEPYHGGCQ